MAETIIGLVIGFLLSQFAEIIKSEIRRNKILAALHSLVLEALPDVSSYNKTVTEQSETEHLVPKFYPTASFESAFLSENGVSVKKETIQATIKYLNKANDLNSAALTLRDTFYVPKQGNAPGSRDLVKTYLLNELKNQVDNSSMHKIIDDLRIQIEVEQKRNLWVRLWLIIVIMLLAGIASLLNYWFCR